MGFISKLFVIYEIGCEEFVFDLYESCFDGEKLVSGSFVWMV